MGKGLLWKIIRNMVLNYFFPEINFNNLLGLPSIAIAVILLVKGNHRTVKQIAPWGLRESLHHDQAIARDNKCYQNTGGCIMVGIYLSGTGNTKHCNKNDYVKSLAAHMDMLKNGLLK